MQLLDFLEQCSDEFTELALPRSVVEAAERNPWLRRRREVRWFCSRSTPHQHRAILEDRFHDGIASLVDKLLGVVTERLAEAEGDARSAAARGTSRACRSCAAER